MVENHTVRSGLHKRVLLVVIAALASTLSTLLLTSAALAVEHHPKGEYAPFADCPLSNPETHLCVLAHTESGEVTLGKKTVPINADKKHEIVLQGGIAETATTQTFIGAEDGNTLSKTPQNVPGGLAGLIECKEIKNNPIVKALCESVFERGLTGVTATTELAAPASSIGISIQAIFEEEGVALKLPVKVHLENTLLGGSCYVGSNAKPIILELTDGTTNPPLPNKPIKGKLGTVTLNEAVTIATITENSLVDNAFGAPKSEGCGGLFSAVIGPIIDNRIGLPSTAGHNTAILNGTLKDANAEAVKESE
jgi:hypothetical protein